ncbi:MAG: hypothetical protein ACRCXZ_08015 [Patescibacteria group bacterium]
MNAIFRLESDKSKKIFVVEGKQYSRQEMAENFPGSVLDGNITFPSNGGRFDMYCLKSDSDQRLDERFRGKSDSW